jgi:hypothetical protein
MNSVREARIQNGENQGALILESQIFRALDLLSLYICVYAAGRMGVHALGAALYMAGFTAENSVGFLPTGTRGEGRSILAGCC